MRFPGPEGFAMRTLRHISGILFFIAAYICLPAILVVLTADVTLRFGFNAPIRWAQEFASILLFLSIVLALPESWLKHAHVKADFLQHLLSANAREFFARCSWGLILAVSIVIIWQCWRDVQYMMLIDESTPELYVPMSYLRGALALASAISGVIAIMKLCSRRRVAEDIEGAGQ